MKILIVKIGAIGDVIMALSMVPEIKEKYPLSQISWVCGKTASPIVHLVKEIDNIYELNDSKLLTGNFFFRILELIKLWRKISFQNFHTIIDGHPDTRYKLLYFLSFRKHHYKFNRKPSLRIRPVAGRHHSDEYAMLVNNFDGNNDLIYKPPVLKFSLSENLSFIYTLFQPTIVISPGGAKNLMRDDHLRRWPIENYVQLADLLLEKNYSVIITGAISDEWVSANFINEKIINLIGRLDLQDTVALYQKCDLLISHDSGPLHFSALANMPVVALFGPTNPFEKVPRHSKNKILWGGESLSCRPCYDGTRYAACENNICMKMITVPMVMEKINEIIRS